MGGVIVLVCTGAVVAWLLLLVATHDRKIHARRRLHVRISLDTAAIQEALRRASLAMSISMADFAKAMAKVNAAAVAAASRCACSSPTYATSPSAANDPASPQAPADAYQPLDGAARSVAA